MTNLSHIKTAKKLLLASLLPAMMLTGCGGGDSSSGSGTVSFSLTDAPIDSAKEVWITITGLSVQQGDDEWEDFVFDVPKKIDLLTLQGVQKESLLSEEPLPSGEYTQIRLDVVLDDPKEDPADYDTYIVTNDGVPHVLAGPSFEQTGLKIVAEDSLSVPENGHVAFTIDFDVRKSIVAQGNGEYKLKPVLRIEQDNSIGHIEGTVGATLMSECIAPENTGDTTYVASPVVYAFNGTYDLLELEGIEEVSSSLISYNSDSSAYEFEVGYLPAGSYSVAFNCVISETTTNAETGEVTTTDTNDYRAVEPVEVFEGEITTGVSLEVPADPAPEEPAA
ncbi:DUF4382 domain-containing protein [Thiomicrorhabdus xiamenensis]|uniref:DUF4382 domain-containing protein n=1 Tax=Thiomicrorhabdus xiamenensis TaxID=2739063 RepID=A0A7D4NS77_9GAMM|nr:DUF4382 domain-containing protein [Thiomicrorhabdus xiamenensis]QKI89717.1 DUF4382 domain-containing protein [Thiomicrorhabdus xiamenensis]